MTSRPIARTLLLPIVFAAIFSSTMNASQYTLASVNPGFEDGTNGWLATGNTANPALLAQRDWTPDPNSPVEAQLGTNFLFFDLEAQQTGYGQYVVLNEGVKTQVVACQGMEDFGWAAFGVTYYDASWNEVEIFRKRFGPSASAGRGFGDGMLPYSLGCEVPDGAVFAFIWVWQETSGGTFTSVDELALYDFVPTDEDNLLLNGDFASGDVNANSGDAFLNGLEFWESNADDGSLVYDTGTQQLTMGEVTDDLIYQRVPVVATQNYSLSISYSRNVGDAPVPDTGGGTLPWAIAGVDFFREDGSSNGALFNISMQAQPGQNATRTRDFTPPADTAYAYAWVWVQGSVATVQTLNLGEFRLIQNAADTTPPTASFPEDLTITETVSGGRIRFGVEYVDDVTTSPSRPNRGETLTILGPNGFEVSTGGVAGGSLPGTGLFEIYELDGPWSSAQNGEYAVYLNEGSLVDEAGNFAPAQMLGTFQLALPPAVE